MSSGGSRGDGERAFVRKVGVVGEGGCALGRGGGMLSGKGGSSTL